MVAEVGGLPYSREMLCAPWGHMEVVCEETKVEVCQRRLGWVDSVKAVQKAVAGETCQIGGNDQGGTLSGAENTFLPESRGGCFRTGNIQAFTLHTSA